LARRVYFAFHYERDVWRVNIVRNSWVAKPDRETAGFVDAADFEEVKKKGDAAVERWIDSQLEGTSVTAVLIGTETSDRPYVNYEIKKSYSRGNGLLGIYIHNIEDRQGNTDSKGRNPFETLYIEKDGQKVYLSQMYPTYDWVNDKGYSNFAEWVESAAKQAGR
jgi:hypothetical protein